MSATSTNGRSFPSLFAILPYKTKPVLAQFWRLVKKFVGDYKPVSLLTDLEVSATRAFIQVFGDVKVTICLAEDRTANELGEEDPELSNFCHMIAAMPFVPPKEIERVFDAVFMACIGKHSKKIDDILVYARDNYIGAGGQEEPIPVHLWSQFEAVLSDEDICQSILLEGLKKALNMEQNSSQEELVWATIGRFGLEEELQAMGWREALLEVEYIFRSYNIKYQFLSSGT